MVVRQSNQVRKVRDVGGGIYRGGIITADDCMNLLGLGHESMSAARRSGIVKPIDIGRRRYYVTDEVMDWMLTQRK